MAKSRYRKAYEKITGMDQDPFYSEERMGTEGSYHSASARKAQYPGLQRGELTPTEVHRTGEVAESGFTVRTTGSKAGSPARNVFSTGFAPELGRGAEVAVTPDEPAWSQIRKFNVANPVLGTKGTDMAIGGWRDPATGKVQMDTSVLTPKTPSGLEAAMHIAVQGRQAAIGNLGPSAKNPYIGDINIPSHLNIDQYKQNEAPLGHEPKVESLGRIGEGGRERVRITPGLQEAIGVEAGEMSREMGLAEKPRKEKGAAQYVKESLSYLRRTRRPAR